MTHTTPEAAGFAIATEVDDHTRLTPQRPGSTMLVNVTVYGFPGSPLTYVNGVPYHTMAEALSHIGELLLEQRRQFHGNER